LVPSGSPQLLEVNVGKVIDLDDYREGGITYEIVIPEGMIVSLVIVDPQTGSVTAIPLSEEAEE